MLWRTKGRTKFFHSLTPTLKSPGSSLGSNSRTSQTASPISTMQKLDNFIPCHANNKPGAGLTHIEEKLSHSDLDTAKHISDAVNGFTTTHEALEQLQHFYNLQQRRLKWTLYPDVNKWNLTSTLPR